MDEKLVEDYRGPSVRPAEDSELYLFLLRGRTYYSSRKTTAKGRCYREAPNRGLAASSSARM